MDYPPPKPAMVAPADPAYPSPRMTLTIKTVQTVRVEAKGEHVHVCPKCSTEWSHSDLSAGSVNDPVARAAHTCPACHTLLPGFWVPAQRNTRIETRESLRATVPYCPPGGT